MISSQKLAQLQGILFEKQEIVRRNEERIHQLIDKIALLRQTKPSDASSGEESTEDEEIVEAKEEDNDVASRHPRKIGEFALRDTSTLIPVEYAKPFLKKAIFELPPNTPQPGLPLNLLDGVDSFFCVEHKNERFPAFLRWIQETAPPNQTLTEFLRGCEFVSLRGTLNRLPKGRPVVCCKYEGVIFMCEAEWKNLDSAKNLLYAQIMLRNFVTEIRTKNIQATDKTDEFYMVYECGEKTKTSAKFCYATKTDCVDEDGAPVQIPPFVNRSRQSTFVNPTSSYLDRRSAVVVAKRFTNFSLSLSEVALEKCQFSAEFDEKSYLEIERLQQHLAMIRAHFADVRDGEYVCVKSGKEGLQFSQTEYSFLPTTFQKRFKQ